MKAEPAGQGGTAKHDLADEFEIVAAGPLPPPVHGAAIATERVIERLRKRGAVHVLSVAPHRRERSLAYHLYRAERYLVLLTALARRGGRPRKRLYLACEGGAGLLYTLLATTVARALGFTVYLHHHSFSYVLRGRRLMRLVLRAGGDRLRHIFLCPSMAAAFERIYGRCPRRRIVSNAALVKVSEQIPKGNRDDGGLTIGLLSNLIPEKGYPEFLRTLRLGRERGLPVHGVLAGPAIGEADRQAIAAAEADLGPLALDYRGSVKGVEKDRFFRDVDIFVFPTTYALEAQPLVLIEAMAAGCAVISFARGCIDDMCENVHNTLIGPGEDFTACAVERLAELVADPAALLGARRAALESAVAARNAAEIQLQELAAEMFAA